MNRTVSAVESFLEALRMPEYDMGVLSDRGMLPVCSLSREEIVSRIPMLRWQNAGGAHIYVRPAGEHSYSLLDDLDSTSLFRLHRQGYEPAAVVETSPGNYQAWLKHAAPLPREVATLAAQTLARRFGGDVGAADWRHFGRLPGFTNRKLKHQRPDGTFPFVLLRSAGGQVFSSADRFATGLRAQATVLEAQRQTKQLNRHGSLSPQWGERSSYLSLDRFRALERYAGCPAQADIAFCIAAMSTEMPEASIREALDRHYLSSDPSHSRRAAYLRRTISTARAWTAPPSTLASTLERTRS